MEDKHAEERQTEGGRAEGRQWEDKKDKERQAACGQQMGE